MPGAQKTKAAKMGFSLLEVLITMGLLTVLSLAMSSYLGFTQAAMVGVKATTDFESMVMILQGFLKKEDNCKKMIGNVSQGGQVFMLPSAWSAPSNTSASLKIFRWDGSGEVFLQPGVQLQEAFRIQDISYEGATREDLTGGRKEYQGYLILRALKGRNPAVAIPGGQGLQKKIALQLVTDSDGVISSCRSTGGADDPENMCQSMGGVWSTVTTPPSCVFRSPSTPTMLVCPGSPGCGAASSTALTGTWTVPDRVTSITVTAVGGGGGGGGASDGNSGWNNCRSGGGGGGGELVTTVISTQPGTLFRWRVGQGGAGSLRAGTCDWDSLSGQDGGDSEFGVLGQSSNLIIAQGGGGALAAIEGHHAGVGGSGRYPGQSGTAGGSVRLGGGGAGGGAWSLPLPLATGQPILVHRGGAGGAARWWNGSHGDVGAPGGRGTGGGGGGCGDNGGGSCDPNVPAKGGRGGDGGVVIVYQQDPA